MSLLIRNATVVTAEETKTADVLVEGEVIKEVRPGIPLNAAQKLIDAAGMYVLPGGIDCHTHLDMPFGGTTSVDDFETGTRAAAFGGTTSIVDFAIQGRGTRMRDALDTWWKKAEGKACVDYGLHMIVTDLGGCGLEDMDELVDEGVASFKLFMAYPNVLMVDDATIFKALSRTAKNRAPRPRPCIAPSRWRRSRARRCTSCIFRARMRSTRCERPVTAACPPLPRP